jgi:signal transduction histidine kinase/DNA-binding response OmpR family regulator
MVRAYSGRDALREVLKREFAVILLDVNMPGMDGFETASMIRQRRNSADTPIIFLTAMGDDMHVARSYSLGAVDYILTPVVPQILRSKVAVFVELSKKTQQIKRQAERLRQRAAQTHQLMTASIAISSATTVEGIIRLATETACRIIGVHQAVSLMVSGHYPLKQASFASYSSKYADWSGIPPYADSPAFLAMLSGANKPIRLVQLELETLVPTPTPAGGGPMLQGLLAAPLSGRNGRNLGTILVSEKAEGDFTDDDHAVLIQLAQMASVAVENVIYAAEREDNRLKEEFLSTLSHELRTPLTAISSWVQLLRREPVEGEVAHGLEVIDRSVQAQTRLIEDLLDLSRINTGKFRLNRHPIRLRPVLEAAIDALRPVIAERRINLSCDLDGADPTVIGDQDRLQQVFWNLLANAAKFTPSEGTITVKLRCAGGAIKFVVEDTGQGIEREFLPHIFNRFRQADGGITRRHGGLGIGLTIVRHIVELHGGTVTADSAGKGRGAVFTVILAEAVDGQAAIRESSDSAELNLPSLEGMNVLLVDDNPDAREVLAELLRRQQAGVTVAASAREALAAMGFARPDILVTDLGMPDEDGFALLKEMRRLPEGARTPAIAITAHAMPEDRVASLQAGFHAHLAKPVDARELINVIHQCGRRPAGAAAAQAG